MSVCHCFRASVRLWVCVSVCLFVYESLWVRLHQGLDPRHSLDNLDHHSTRQSTAPWRHRLLRILGGMSLKGQMGPPGTCLEASQLSVTDPYIHFGEPKSNYSMMILKCYFEQTLCNQGCSTTTFMTNYLLTQWPILEISSNTFAPKV